MATDTPVVEDPVDETNEDGFDEGFTQTEPTPTETPAEEVQAETKPEPEPEPQVEHVQLTKAEYEDFKARIAAIDQIKATQDKSFGTAFGKLGGLERDLQNLKSGKRIEIDQKDIDALRDDFPPLAAALEKVRELQVVGGSDVDPAKIQPLIEERVKAEVTQIEQRLEKRALAKAHPDWEQFQNDAKFVEWVKKQPQEYQQKLATTWDADVISDAMTKAKEAAKPKPTPAPRVDPAAARRSRMAAAVAPKGTGGQRASDPDAEFDSGFKSG